MSEHEPYGQQPYGQQPYAQQPYGYVQAPPAPMGGYGFPRPRKSNTMAILGLVFSFIFPLLGIIFSAVGLKQTKERDESGRGLAVAGLIVSIVVVLAGVLVVSLRGSPYTPTGVVAAVIPSAERPSTSAARSSSPDDEAVHAACTQIQFVLETMDLSQAKTLAEYQSKINRVVSTLQNAAPGTGPQFSGDVQKLIDDLDTVAAMVAKGQDPSSYRAALVADANRLDLDCSAVGVN